MEKAGKNKILSLVLAGCIILSTVGGALAPLFVYGLPPALIKARTVGELIVTLFAASGTAITNNTVVPAIYSAYDSSYYSLESMVNNGVLVPADGSTTEAAIESIGTGNKNYKPFNLDSEKFREYIYGNWDEMESYGIDAVLRLNEIANTDNVYGAIDNLGQLVLDVANYGYLGVSNAIAIIANPESVIQVSLDNVKDALQSVFGQKIINCIPINIGISPNGKTVVVEYIQNNRKLYNYIILYGDYGNIFWCKIPGGISVCSKGSINGYTNKIVSSLEGEQDGYLYTHPGGDVTTIHNLTGNNISKINIYGATYIGDFTTSREFLDFLRNNDVNTNIVSPDIINQDQGNITDIDDASPAISGNEKLYIIDSDDYNNFVNDSKSEPGISNAEIMQDLLVPYITEIDDKESWEDPGIPETNPINPAQPTVAPKPEVDPGVVDDILIPVVPDITGVFPFCIPWDILAFVRGLKVERQAPVISWNFRVDRIGLDYVFTIDFSDYENVAEILRSMELILFIISLAVATRKLIGA